MISRLSESHFGHRLFVNLDMLAFYLTVVDLPFLSSFHKATMKLILNTSNEVSQK